MTPLYIRDKSEFIKKSFDHENEFILSISKQEMEENLKERNDFKLWSFVIGDKKAEITKQNIEEQIIIANNAAKEIEKHIGKSLKYFTVTMTKSDLAKRLTGDSTYLTTIVYFYMNNREVNKSFNQNWKELKAITRKFQSENLNTYTEERAKELEKIEFEESLLEEERNETEIRAKIKKAAKYMVYFTVLITLISFIEFN